MENRVTVTTPEYVHLEFETAGIGSRAVAILIDWVILGSVMLILSILAILFANVSEPAGSPFWTSAVQGVFIITVAFTPLCYYTLTETFLSGRTVGKMATGLRVVTDRGTAPGFPAVFLRNLLRFADSLPFLYMTGIVTVFIHPREKRLGDLAAGTMVVRKERANSASPEERIQVGTGDGESGVQVTRRPRPSLREQTHPGDEPVLTSRELAPFTEAEWTLLARFLARRTELFPDRRRELGERLVAALLPETKVEPGREEALLEAAYVQLSPDHEPPPAGW